MSARIDHQHLHFFLGRDNVCTEVHMPKVYLKPGEESVFGEIFRTIQYKEIALPTSDARLRQSLQTHDLSFYRVEAEPA